MRYALLSDVHANRPALDAVLRDITARAGVAANYDSTVATDYAHCGCRSESPRQEEIAHASYEWTRAHVSPRTKAHLAGLPFRIDLKPLGGHVAGPTVTLVHATPTNNLVYVTEDRPDAF